MFYHVENKILYLNKKKEVMFSEGNIVSRMFSKKFRNTHSRFKNVNLNFYYFFMTGRLG